MNYKQQVFDGLINKQIELDSFLTDLRIDIFKQVAIKVADAYESLSDSVPNPVNKPIYYIEDTPYTKTVTSGCDGCAFDGPNQDRNSENICSVPDKHIGTCIDEKIIWIKYNET